MRDRSATLTKVRYLLPLALVACTAQRPEGAYTPEPLPDTDGWFEEEDGGEPLDEEPVEIPQEDGGEPEPGLDEDAAIPADLRERVAGRYLMRVDYFSTANAVDGQNKLTLKNRISNLFFTEIKLVEGQLIATEQLCFQSYAHQCVQGCEPWTTQVDSPVNAKLAERRIERVYAVSEEGSISVPRATLMLGFDPDGQPDLSDLPTTYTDPRVWKLGSEPKRAGVCTKINATLRATGPVPLTQSLNCIVDVVQRFDTSFGGQLDLRVAAPLTKLVLPIDAGATELKTIFVGNASSLREDLYCNEEKIRTSSSSGDQAFVRFKSAGTIAGCPSSAKAFEDAFKVGIDPPGP